MRYTKRIIAIIISASGALMMAAATTAPTAVDSNIAAWLRLLGVHNPPPAFATTHADQWAFWLGLAVLAVGLVGVWEWFFVKPKGAPQTQVDSPPEHTITDQSVKSYNQTGGITAHNVTIGPPPPKVNTITPMEITTRGDGTFQRYFTFEIVSETPLKTLLVAITGPEILDISFNPLDQGMVNFGQFPRKGDTNLFRLSSPSGRYQVVINNKDDKSPVTYQFEINQ